MQAQSLTELPPHSALPIRGKTNKQTKNLAQLSPYMTLTQTTEPNLGGQKTKGRKNSNSLKTEKETSTTISLKKNEKVEKFCTNEGTN